MMNRLIEETPLRIEFKKAVHRGDRKNGFNVKAA